eukprot:4256022-Alexandrium_andersonii.AAC.1
MCIRDSLLLCDGCDRAFHTYCLDELLEQIPAGDWFFAPPPPEVPPVQRPLCRATAPARPPP